MKALWRALRFSRPYWPMAVGTFLCLLVATSSMLVTPRVAQMIIDRGIAQRDSSLIMRLSLGMIGLALLYALFQFLQGALATRLAQGIAFDMRNALYARIQSLSFSYHDRAQTGQLLTRATSDVDTVQYFVGMGAQMFLSALLMLIGALVLLFVSNWRLALIMVIVVPVTMGLFSLFARRAMPMFKAIQQSLGNLNTVLQENLVGIRVVKAFVREDYEAQRYRDANRELYDLSLAVNRLLSLAFPAIFSVSNVATLCVYWIGGWQVIQQALSLGELVAFSNYVMMAFFPLLTIGMIIAMLSSAGASAERIFDILTRFQRMLVKGELRGKGFEINL